MLRCKSSVTKHIENKFGSLLYCFEGMVKTYVNIYDKMLQFCMMQDEKYFQGVPGTFFESVWLFSRLLVYGYCQWSSNVDITLL